MGSFPPAEWVYIGTTSGLIVLWASTTSLYSFPLLLATVHPLLYYPAPRPFARSDSRPAPCSMTSSMLTLLPMRSKTMFRNMVARSQEDFHTQPTKGNRGGEPIAGTGIVSPWPAGASGGQLADATYYPPRPMVILCHPFEADEDDV